MWQIYTFIFTKTLITRDKIFKSEQTWIYQDHRNMGVQGPYGKRYVDLVPEQPFEQVSRLRINPCSSHVMTLVFHAT